MADSGFHHPMYPDLVTEIVALPNSSSSTQGMQEHSLFQLDRFDYCSELMVCSGMQVPMQGPFPSQHLDNAHQYDGSLRNVGEGSRTVYGEPSNNFMLTDDGPHGYLEHPATERFGSRFPRRTNGSKNIP